jgi:hypothetical protein
MIFETLQESNRRGELLLVEGGYLRWHLRRNNAITIYEIISQRPGAGTAMLERLKMVEGATSIVARCPADLLSGNAFYWRRDFALEASEITRSGRLLNVWRLRL